MNPTLIKNFLATAAIAAYRIVKPGADDDHVTQATASTEALIGVTGKVDADAAEDRIDVTLAGIAEIEFGGNVTRGALVTADADGKAVAAAPAAGVNASVIGRALVSGVAGDVGAVLLAPGQIQGA